MNRTEKTSIPTHPSGKWLLGDDIESKGVAKDPAGSGLAVVATRKMFKSP